MESKRKLWVGIDWSHDIHEVCVIRSDGQELRKEIAQSGDGLDELRSWLLEQSEGRPADISVAIEISHGAVVEMLMELGCAVFSINPKQAERFRERYSVSGAKDDRRDAWVLARALRSDPEAFHHLEPDVPVLIELRECSRMLQEIRDQQMRISSRIREQLLRYFPQMLQVAPDPRRSWFLQLWREIPTPRQARDLTPEGLQGLLKGLRVRRINSEQMWEMLTQKPLPVCEATTKAAARHIEALIEQMELAKQQESWINREIAGLMKSLNVNGAGGAWRPGDVEIVTSVPGAGSVVAATLFSEGWRPLSAMDYQRLRALSGAAPVTKRSGKRRRPLVVMRQACSHRLREAVYHMARVAVQTDQHWKTLYAAMRRRGHSHGRAVRGVADRLLRVLCAMLRSRTHYDRGRLGPLAAS
jgi:transposase